VGERGVIPGREEFGWRSFYGGVVDDHFAGTGTKDLRSSGIWKRRFVGVLRWGSISTISRPAALWLQIPAEWLRRHDLAGLQINHEESLSKLQTQEAHETKLRDGEVA